MKLILNDHIENLGDGGQNIDDFHVPFADHSRTGASRKLYEQRDGQDVGVG